MEEEKNVEISEKLAGTGAMPKKKRLNIAALREKDRQPVEGIFHFYELPGGVLDFSYKKYKDEPIETFSLMDGNKYTLPLGVAKHLNNSGFYEVHEYNVDENGRPSTRIGKKVRRYGFQSLEFVDDDFITDSDRIVTVTPLKG